MTRRMLRFRVAGLGAEWYGAWQKHRSSDSPIERIVPSDGIRWAGERVYRAVNRSTGDAWLAVIAQVDP